MNTLNLKSLQNQHHIGANNGQDTRLSHKDKEVSSLDAFAAPLVHDTVFNLCLEIVKSHEKGKALNVLVLGAGSGYFDKKLMDHGIKSIDAIEYIPEHYKVKGTRLYSYDLNNSWAHKLLTQNHNRKYDLIIAIEVIEHLENHFMLMREIQSILAYNGQIIITSPNVESSFSRIRFLLTEYLEYFGPTELDGTGHINPVLTHIFKLNLKLNNIKLLHIYHNRNIWLSRIRDSRSFKKIFIICLSLITFFCFIFKNKNIYKSKTEGEINIYHLKNIN